MSIRGPCLSERWVVAVACTSGCPLRVQASMKQLLAFSLSTEETVVSVTIQLVPFLFSLILNILTRRKGPGIRLGLFWLQGFWWPSI